jgi:hypothetical protein
MSVIAVGKKFDSNRSEKPRFSILPWDALRIVVGVLEHGGDKYGLNNWRHVADGPRRYSEAAGRHLVAWWGGEVLDPESHRPHLAHAAASTLFALALEQNPPRLPGIQARIEELASKLARGQGFDDEEGARLALIELAELTGALDRAGVRR